MDLKLPINIKYVTITCQKTEIWAMLLNGGPGAFGANQEGNPLLISVTYEFIQLIAYF